MSVVVAGGGLAGAAVAAELAQKNVAVTLIERQAEPVHKICGEFLSSEAQAYLARIGLPLGAEGGAPISRLRLVRNTSVIEAALPFQGLGLSRRRLDEALLRHAERSGARVLRGRTIRSLDAARLTLEVQNEGAIAAETLLLATGKHELRGAKRQAAARGERIGFKMHFRLNEAAQAALASHIELIFFDGGYAGLQMIEDDMANLCLLVRRDVFSRCGETWQGLLAYMQDETPYLARQLAQAAPLWPQPLAISRVPFGFIHRPGPENPERLFRLGDQACVIQPFTGDGMAIALHSAALAARMVVQNRGAAEYHRRLAGDVAGQMRWAEALDGLLNHALTQPLMFGLARLWPLFLGKAAKLTRVPPRARL